MNSKQKFEEKNIADSTFTGVLLDYDENAMNSVKSRILNPVYANYDFKTSGNGTPIVSYESAKPTHYNNEKGSIYKFCNDQDLNPWEFDIIKRIVRCRKKGQFKDDLEKTKIAIDLYLKEYNG